VSADPRKRWWLYGGLLVGSAGLAFFGDSTPERSDGELAKPVDRPVASSHAESVPEPSPTRRASEQHAEPAILLALVPRDELIRETPSSSTDLFAAMSWAPPPPPPVAPAPAPPPAAPALPFAYAGKKRQDGQWEVYLVRGEMTYIVRQGSIVEDQYVVERIAPPAMSFKYRPLGQSQTLLIGE